MMGSPFSPVFVEQWGRALNASDLYAHEARNWEGAVVLTAFADPAKGLQTDVALFLDLAHGRCHAAREATDADRRSARFVIAAPYAAWMSVLRGEMAPTMAIMRGTLKLEKGFLPALLPHVGAANALVAVARDLLDASTADEAASAAAIANTHQAERASTPAESPAPRHAFRTTSAAGLRYDTFPMRLWDKAKRLGIWNPADIDFSADRADWDALKADERDLLLRLATLFQSGEEAVVIDILPLLDVVAQEGRIEEQLYLTSFVWEEAKHVEGMRRFLDAIGAGGEELTRYHTPAYRTIFEEALPQAMHRLRTDRSPVAQARASATYNMIVEGVLAETGYHVFHEVLVTRGIMPGMQQMAGYLKLDESRHIAYGLYLLSRLAAEHGDDVWKAIVDTMNRLIDPAIAVVTEAFAAYPEDAVPFGLTPAPFIDFAMGQFDKRLQRLETARTQHVAELDALES
jgi:ribonucleoside-diphosphate reductase beta chain